MTEPTVKASSDAMTKGAQAAKKVVEANTAALTESGTASSAAVHELTKAYQALASKPLSPTVKTSPI